MFCRSRKAILPGAFGLAAVLSLVAYLRRSDQQCEEAPLHLFIIVSCATLGVFSLQLSALYMLHRTRQKPVLALLVLTSAFAFAWAVAGAVWTGMSETLCDVRDVPVRNPSPIITLLFSRSDKAQECSRDTPGLYRVAVSSKVLMFVCSTVLPFLTTCCRIERCCSDRSYSLEYSHNAIRNLFSGREIEDVERADEPESDHETPLLGNA
jgi:hypothetical protein